MADEPDLLREILRDPRNDTPRLIYADWLEDHGQCERAEFIRCQIEIANAVVPTGDTRQEFDEAWDKADKLRRKMDALFQKYKDQWFGDICKPIESYYVSRGFPSSVTLPLEVFVGDACDECDGRGGRSVYERGEYGPNLYSESCDNCHGTGRVPGSGIAKKLFSTWPITKIEFSDTYSAPLLRTGLSQTPVNYGRLVAGLPPLAPPVI